MFKSIETSKNILNKEKALEDLLDREIIGSTGIGLGVAIPHAKTNAVDDIVISLGILKEEIDFETTDNSEVNLIFMFFSPEDKMNDFLTILAKISRYIQNEEFRLSLLNSKTSDEIVEKIKNFELN